MKLHNNGRKNTIYTSSDVFMLGHGCGMSQYPQFYDWELDKHQVLPSPYLGSFKGDNG